MFSESDNPEQGTDNAQAQADDTAESWDYYDPDEEQDNVETPEQEATDDGTAPADEAVETEAPEAVEIVAAPDAVVVKADGSKIKVSDLIEAGLRQDDYSRKTQQLSNERSALKTEVERLEGITQAFVEHLEKLVPPAPDHTVALRDPQKYTRDMAVHQAAMAQLQAMIETAQGPKAIKEALSKEDQARVAQDENAKLVQKFPTLSNPAERQKFFSEAVDAASEFGLSMDELQGVTDHRIFAALHYAAKGLKADKAMQVAKAKVAKAPPVAPQKPAGAGKGPANIEAMKRLNRSGSMKDALKIDWD